jgi:hypothetical protein
MAVAEPQAKRFEIDTRQVELATALFSLSFHSLKDPEAARSVLDRHHPGWTLYPVDHALRILHDQFEAAKPIVALSALVRLAHSGTQDLSPRPSALETAAPYLAHGIAPSGVPEAPSVSEAFDDVLSKFPRAPEPEGAEGAVEAHAIEVDPVPTLHDILVNIPPEMSQREALAYGFAQTLDALGYSPPDFIWPLCVDDQVVVGNILCNRVHTVFRTRRSVDEMSKYIDPRCWPGCCVFWAAMDQMSFDPPAPGAAAGGGANVANGPQPGTVGRWIGVFDEVVVGLPVGPILSPLQFAHFETKDPATNALTFVQNTYRLVTPTDDFLVDEGYMYAKQIPDDHNDGMTTYVELEKIVKFSYPTILDVWPDFPCDTFWGAMALVMATACSDNF